MLLLLIPVLMIIWGFWWIYKPPKYPKNPDNLGNFFIGYRTQWALKSPDTWLYSHVRYGRWMVGLGLVSLVLTVVFVFVLPANIVERAILAMDVIMLRTCGTTTTRMVTGETICNKRKASPVNGWPSVCV